MNSHSIVVVVRYRMLPGQEALAKQAVTALVAEVLSRERECQGITILQDAGDPSGLMLIEHWPDQATFLGPHMQQPHIQQFIQQAGKFLAGPPDISFWHSVNGA